MNRRDIIIIAVLINAGLLAILFMTAINTDDRVNEEPQIAQLIGGTSSDKKSISSSALSGQDFHLDENDEPMQSYSSGDPYEIVLLDEKNDSDSEDQILDSPRSPETEKGSTADQYVEVTVKRGDFLEKIARANGTTVSAIKKANNLSSEKIEVGQVLRIPLNTAKNNSESKVSITNPKSEDKIVVSTEALYYTIKSGDNPWKIAKQFNVKFDDLIKLNNLDEEKARNLKVGDKIRVK
jgi:peptidoglycan DL-endopeptidase LytF